MQVLVMADFSGFGRLLMVGGVVLFLLGLLFTFGGRIPLLGHLPGDILIHRKGFTFSFPVVTCIIISLLMTLVLNLISRR